MGSADDSPLIDERSEPAGPGALVALRRSRRARRRRAVGIAVPALLALATIAGLVPVLQYRGAKRWATGCFASVETPRGPELPDCRRAASMLALPARAPWTARAARWLLEEVPARMAVAEYTDAAVGTPAPARFDAAREAVSSVRFDLDAGTARLRLDELGPLLPAPEPWDVAADLGDWRALSGREGGFQHWYTAVRAIDAALGRARWADAARIAAAELGRDATELELRAGAVQCALGEPAVGLAELIAVQDDWANERRANFGRAWGQARVLVEACAALAGQAPPELPKGNGGGPFDHREQLAALRLGVAERAERCDLAGGDAVCAARPEVAARLADAFSLLESGEPLRHRLALVALLAPMLGNAERALAISTAARGEVAFEPGLVPHDWLSPPADEPAVSAERYAVAWRAFFDLRGKHPALGNVAARLALRATRGFALRGETEQAIAFAARSAPVVGGDGALLASAIARHLGGDTAGAYASLEASHALSLPAARALHAELAAQLRRAEATSPGWISVVSGNVPVFVDRPAFASSDPSARAQADRERLEWLATCMATGPVDGADGALEAPPWVGSSRLSLPSVRAERLAMSQGAYRRALAAPAPARRAFRYALLSRRGDAPDALASFLVCAGRLVDASEDVETWLDAVMAVDAARFSLRAMAFARAEAAGVRGDDAAAAAWAATHAELEARAADPARAELFRALRF